MNELLRGHNSSCQGRSMSGKQSPNLIAASELLMEQPEQLNRFGQLDPSQERQLSQLCDQNLLNNLVFTTASNMPPPSAPITTPISCHQLINEHYKQQQQQQLSYHDSSLGSFPSNFPHSPRSTNDASAFHHFHGHLEQCEFTVNVQSARPLSIF